MIIQGLCDYYDRLENNIEYGLDRTVCDIIFLIDENGKLINIEDTREFTILNTGKKKYARGKIFVLPKPIIRSSGKSANFMWDNTKYTVMDDVCIKLFIENIKSFISKTNIENIEIDSVIKFLENDPYKQIQALDTIDTTLKEYIMSGKPNSTFRIVGKNDIVFDSIKQLYISKYKDKNDVDGYCIISGKNTSCSRIHFPIKGIKKTQPTGASLSSFNLESVISHNFEQNMNAPISSIIVDKYTKALNLLLTKKSNKIVVGESTMVFWSTKNDDVISPLFQSWFSPCDLKKESPDSNVLELKSAINGIFTNNKTESNNSFHILSLLPQKARVIISDYKEIPISEICEKINTHINDISIIDDNTKPLYHIANELVYNSKDSEKIVGNIISKIVKSVISDSLYPTIIVSKCLDRIKSERVISKERASLLKMYWNKYIRFYKTNQKEITMTLDNENKNIGYLLGRLFATLEQLKNKANPSARPLSESFLTSFSTTPNLVFPKLMKMSEHHSKKLLTAHKIFFNKKISELISNIENVPTNLNSFDQSMFHLGFFHQKNDFFKKKA